MSDFLIIPVGVIAVAVAGIWIFDLTSIAHDLAAIRRLLEAQSAQYDAKAKAAGE